MLNIELGYEEWGDLHSDYSKRVIDLWSLIKIRKNFIPERTADHVI